MSDIADYNITEIADYFEYLDDLRSSGEVNMFGTRPYLAEEFAIPKAMAGKILMAWMNTFGKGTPTERAQRIKAVQS